MATRLMNPDVSPADYVFKIGLLIKHPSRNLAGLSALLRMEADFVHSAGMRRTTPTGRIIAGVYPDHVWSRYQVIENSRDFVGSIDGLLDHLAPYADLLNDLARTGGSTRIVVQLPGGENTGLELPPCSAAKLASLKIGLGLEVFPGFVGRSTVAAVS